MSIFKDKKARNDILLVAAVLLIAGGAWLFITLNKAPGEYAVIPSIRTPKSALKAKTAATTFSL